MADILKRLQDQGRLQENQDLAQAEHDASWADTFSSTPPVEQLRSRLNLADTVSRVAQNRLGLAAQGDRKALQLMEDTAKFKEWQAQAPLREQLLRNRVESTGATERFKAQKDAESMGHVKGFFDELGTGDQPGSPNFQSRLSSLIGKYPGVLSTKAGTELIRNVLKEHKTIEELRPPAGFTAKYRTDDSGKIVADFVPIPKEQATVDIPSTMAPASITQGPKGQTVTYKDKPTETPDTKSAEKERAFHQSSYEKASERRIKAQAAYDKALVSGNKELIKLNKDLVLAADADIIASKNALTSLNQPSPAPTPSTGTAPAIDKMELARRALNDPNATEQHKAAARKLLGQ